MDKDKTVEKVDTLSYAGFDLQTANEFVKTSKWFVGIFICLQFFLAYSIYDGQSYIAELEGKTLALSDFLLSSTFISVAIATIMMVIYLFTRVFWYALLLGSFLLLETIPSTNSCCDAFRVWITVSQIPPPALAISK